MRRRWRRTGAVFPPVVWQRDGRAPLEVASRFGRLTLQRQVLATGVGTAHETHATPGDAALPPHGGLVITRGLQELACLLPDTLPFVSAERLLGWQTQAASAAAPEMAVAPETKAVLCASTLRTVVREHGAALAEAEWAEVRRLRAALACDDGVAEGLCPRLVPARTPRRRAGWPVALSAAVDQALAAGATRPPRGVRVADWERVLTARRQERSEAHAEEVRRLGPEVGPAEVVASADEVLTRRPQRRQFWELRTARVATAEGFRYVSGTRATFLATLAVLCALCQGTPTGGAARRVVFLADGGRWLRDFFAATLAPRGATLILDWYHLHHRCYQIATQVCRDKPTRVHFLGTLGRLLWRGDVDGAITAAEEFRAAAKAPPDPRRPAPLDEWIAYLEARRTAIPCYRERHRQCQYIGSGQAEKANDLLVARRQKNQGMHWSEETSVALMRLRTLRLNGDWDRYWHQRTFPSLLAA